MLTPQELITFLTRNQFLNPAQGESVLREKQRFLSSVQLCGELVTRNWLTPFQQAQILSGHGDKLIIGSYRLQVPIGEGGMGMVFKAIQPKLDRTVALKIIRPQVLAARPEILSRFHREARAIAQLNHPNIVILFDADEANGTHFIAMEYVEGQTLEKIVRTAGPMSIKQAADYMRQSALGLQHAFEVGLVHRDIKPSNILVAQKNVGSTGSSLRLVRPQLVTLRDRERLGGQSGGRHANNWGVIKILDMGLARLTEGVDEERPQNDYTPLTRAGALLGTPDFIAPEQARDARSVDIRADIYSLGCTFYYILTGKPPFPGGTDVQKLIRHQSEKPFPIEELRPGIMPEVVQILSRMMEKRPEDRYHSPQQLADALDMVVNPVLLGGNTPVNAIAETPAVAETPVPPAGIPARDDDTSPRTVDSPIAIVKSESQTDTTRVASLRQTRATVSTQAHNGIVSSLAVSNDGRFVVSAGLDGRIRLWDFGGSQPKEVATLPRPGAEMQSVAFSPDNDYVVVGGILQGTSRIWRWDFRQGMVAEWAAYQGDKSGVSALAFSPDGKRLAAAVGPFVVLCRITHRNCSGKEILKGHGHQVRALAFSPDGRRLVSAGEGSSVIIWGFGWLGTSKKGKIEGHADIVTGCTFSPDGRKLATIGYDRAVVVWDAENPKVATSVPLFGHSDNPKVVKFLADDHSLISVGESGQVILWDASSSLKTEEYQLYHPMVAAVAVSPDGRRLFLGSTDGKVSAFTLSSTPVTMQ